MHVFPATANDCILQTNSFGLVNRHIFRPIGRNFLPLPLHWSLLKVDTSLINFIGWQNWQLAKGERDNTINTKTVLPSSPPRTRRTATCSSAPRTPRVRRPMLEEGEDCEDVERWRIVKTDAADTRVTAPGTCWLRPIINCCVGFRILTNRCHLRSYT